MKLGMRVGLGPGHIVLDGDRDVCPQKGGTAPNFRPMSIVLKRLHGWINMLLGTDVGRNPSDIVLD